MIKKIETNHNKICLQNGGCEAFWGYFSPLSLNLNTEPLNVYMCQCVNVFCLIWFRVTIYTLYIPIDSL